MGSNPRLYLGIEYAFCRRSLNAKGYSYSLSKV